ncbi:beta-1,3-galactosyltransferase 5-like [Paramacrobiotus metropolitanus]|uniref:beta-1,3-galactosyltransferase 5-like n=1 Tax=Paramacrobiotus metropolitanus TaxID=2943436 RepID=UPI0024460168|nr:beta-1,3-galactosyltransferase 5-like [Paramacrobiotus metropolitanus]
MLLLDSQRHYVVLVENRRTQNPALADPGIFAVDPGSVQQQYKSSPQPCAPDTFLVVAVITAPRNAGVRAMIRRTWGSLAGAACRTRLLFMLGRVHSHSTQQHLDEEAREHGDLLQSNQFDDTFRSSTIKAMRQSALARSGIKDLTESERFRGCTRTWYHVTLQTLHMYQWCAAYCPSSTFVARVDDDAYLNIPKLYDTLKNQSPDAFYGHVYAQEILNDAWFPQRNPNGKYYSPREEYRQDRYPVYIWGFLIIAPTRLLGKVLYASLVIPYSFLDDVYVTGLVANSSGIPLRHITGITQKTKTMAVAQSCLKDKYTAIHKMGQKDLLGVKKRRVLIYYAGIAVATTHRMTNRSAVAGVGNALESMSAERL